MLSDSMSDAIIVAFLNDVRPVVTTFNELVASSVSMRDPMAWLEAVAAVLTAAKLWSLEASLWACAVRYVETIAETTQAATHGLDCEKLMTLVDDAERRYARETTRRGAERRWEEDLSLWTLTPLREAPAKRFKRSLQAESTSPVFERKFRSLLSGALSHRARLNCKKPAIVTTRAPTAKRSLTPDTSCILPTSDDALNLFACSESHRIG
ncbi:unnamed protein product [Mycena citricolor]|uniref:Uncharacterized protein n=1 Tax=Mycena citricolor TaxID=2018698 RepID=A0AAD2JW96_9AGAR|nr:unnamed protein product [Mycena citricolor]